MLKDDSWTLCKEVVFLFTSVSWHDLPAFAALQGCDAAEGAEELEDAIGNGRDRSSTRRLCFYLGRSIYCCVLFYGVLSCGMLCCAEWGKNVI